MPKHVTRPCTRPQTKQKTRSHVRICIRWECPAPQKDVLRDIERPDAVSVIGHDGKSANTVRVRKQDCMHQVSRESSSRKGEARTRGEFVEVRPRPHHAIRFRNPAIMICDAGDRLAPGEILIQHTTHHAKLGLFVRPNPSMVQGLGKPKP